MFAVRAALRARSAVAVPRQLAVTRMAAPMIARPMAVRFYSAMMEDMEEHTAKFTKDLEEAYDMFEVCRVINNAFSHDLVPSPAVCETALRAARRINEYAVAVRVFEMIEAKVENSAQYEAYLDELKDIREELGIELKADLYPEGILSH